MDKDTHADICRTNGCPVCKNYRSQTTRPELFECTETATAESKCDFNISVSVSNTSIYKNVYIYECDVLYKIKGLSGCKMKFIIYIHKLFFFFWCL